MLGEVHDVSEIRTLFFETIGHPISLREQNMKRKPEGMPWRTFVFFDISDLDIIDVTMENTCGGDLNGATPPTHVFCCFRLNGPTFHITLCSKI